jgi:hypothetical protein
VTLLFKILPNFFYYFETVILTFLQKQGCTTDFDSVAFAARFPVFQSSWERFCICSIFAYPGLFSAHSLLCVSGSVSLCTSFVSRFTIFARFVAFLPGH